jgi:cell filamentation protein
VLRNKLEIRSHSELKDAEFRLTHIRMAEIDQGRGPEGNFDKKHLKAIHHHIFQDVYEWAGHMRNERPLVDGARVEAIGTLSKGETQFLHGSRIDMGLNQAFRPLVDLDQLRQSTPAEFAGIAGRVMADLNYVHPFREGNGRAQQTFIEELGRECGHDVDFTVITQGRMIEASIAVTNDPDHPAMRNMIEDATDPQRREALKSAIADLQRCGVDPDDYYVCTARPGEEITGQDLRP